MSSKELKRNYNISSWPNLKINYWAVPKCGNTAIKVSLSQTKKIINPYSKAKWVHNTNIIEYIDRSTAFSNSFENFAVIRNPYERFISLYKDFGLRRPLRELKSNFIEMKDLDKFIEIICNYIKDNDSVNPHIRTMSSYLIDNDNVLPENVFDIKNVNDYLLKKNVVLRTVNKTSEENILLSSSQKNKIYEMYKEDFINFNYEK